MAAIFEKVSPVMVLFGSYSMWPRWRAATVTVALGYSFNDATYDNAGGSNLLGGDFTEALGGNRTEDRWPTANRDGSALGLDNILAQEGQRSDGPQDGALFTQVGNFAFQEGIVVGGTVGTVGVGLVWQIKPPLEIPPGPPPPGGILSRGRPDGQLMEMICPVSGLGFRYSWGEIPAETDVGEFQTISRVATGFEPIEFDLPNLAGETYSFEKTLNIVTTYTPPDDNPDIGYYPMRGTTTVNATVSATLVFTV